MRTRAQKPRPPGRAGRSAHASPPAPSQTRSSIRLALPARRAEPEAAQGKTARVRRRCVVQRVHGMRTHPRLEPPHERKARHAGAVRVIGPRLAKAVIDPRSRRHRLASGLRQERQRGANSAPRQGENHRADENPWRQPQRDTCALRSIHLTRPFDRVALQSMDRGAAPYPSRDNRAITTLYRRYALGVAC